MMASLPRTCTQCERIKTTDDFYKSVSSKDGLQRVCKRCRSFNKSDANKRNKARRTGLTLRQKMALGQ